MNIAQQVFFLEKIEYAAVLQVDRQPLIHFRGFFTGKDRQGVGSHFRDFHPGVHVGLESKDHRGDAVEYHPENDPALLDTVHIDDPEIYTDRINKRDDVQSGCDQCENAGKKPVDRQDRAQGCQDVEQIGHSQDHALFFLVRTFGKHIISCTGDQGPPGFNAGFLQHFP